MKKAIVTGITGQGGAYLAPTDAKLGWISTWNTKCGIATYSQHLMAGFHQDPFILAANSSDLLTPDGPKCIRCWDAGDDDDLADLTKAIDDLGLDGVVIQWNFGFFHHDHLLDFVQQQKEAKRVVFIDMHSTKDPPQASHKKLANYIPVLALVNRVLVHTISDLNRLKQFGLVQNVALFPHGILDLPIKAKAGKAAMPTIATYGFCLPHKGLEEVVEAVGLLRDAGEHVALRMVNAEYPATISATLVKVLRNKIDALKLGDRISLETNFLTDNESLDLLQGADLILFPYHPTSESASGAVRYGFASGKPTMTTEIPIFSEFGDAAWKVKNNKPELLAAAIKDALEQISSNSPTHKLRQDAAQAFRDQHSYAWLAERLEGMLQGISLDN